VLPADTKPLIVEICREEYGEHTCDKRRTRTEFHSDFPGFAFEEGFEEEDILWSPERETKENIEVRARLFLDRVFTNDSDATCTFASIFLFVLVTVALFPRHLCYHA
jgi:hypothetical protein